MSSLRTNLIRIALALTLLGVIGAVVAVFVFAEPMIRRHAISEARNYGFELEIGELDWGLFWVELHGCKFKLIGVSGISGTSEKIRVETSGLKPKRIAASGLDLQVQGSIGIVTVELSEWTKTFPEAYRLPAEASGVAVTWRSAESGAPPWLAIQGGSLAPVNGGGQFKAPGTKVAGYSVGAIGAAWTAKESTVTLGFGETESERAPIRVRVNHTASPPSADVFLQQTELRRLAEPFGVEIPLDEKVTASAEATLVFEPGSAKADGPISGSFASRLHGFVPPHPKELDGFVFGDITTFDSKFTLSEDRKLLTLFESKVTAGAFVLNGGGKVVRHPDHAKIDLDLRGNLPCDSLAGAATESELGKVLGKTLGKMAGQAAKKAIGGSVAVRVRIDADTRDLPGAKVTPSIGIGCGLKPLKIDIELPKLPPLPSGFPALPSGFPPPPPIPTFSFPKE